MLKTLSLAPDEDRDDPSDEHSESRMLRALEALSSQPQPRHPHDQPHPDQAFRQNKPGAREPFRQDASHHGNKGRHRFVKDGEVPVVHMSPARPRDATAPAPGRTDADWARLQQQCEEHKQRADAADRTRAEAQTLIRTLQTKLAHAELAMADAQALAQSRLEELQALQEDMNKPRIAPKPPATTPAPTQGAGQPTADAPVKRGPGRPRKIVAAPDVPLPEPEPVEWWLLPVKGKRRG